MSNDVPHFTYKIEDMWQSVRSSDRPMCALASANHALLMGKKIGGAGRGLAAPAIITEIAQCISAHGIQTSNWVRWMDALRLKRVGDGAGIKHTVDGLTLDPYQIDTVKNLTVAGGVIAMGCGLGKTITALSAASALVNHVMPMRLWVCCPKIAIPVWEELRTWVEANLTADFEVMSIDSLHKVEGVNCRLPATRIFTWLRLPLKTYSGGCYF